MIEGLMVGIEAMVAGLDGMYGVVVIAPDGQTLYSRNAGTQVQSASLYKLLIMVEVYRQVERGIINFDDPVELASGFFHEVEYDDPFQSSDIGSTYSVEELLYPMITVSSNVAAFALLNLVGNWNINATAAALGLTASEIRWMPALASVAGPAVASYAALFQEAPTADEALNVTDAGDMALLFRLLVEKRVVSPEYSQEMLDLLAGQVVNDRLPGLLPGDAVVAHKTGNVDNVSHDAGVIYAPNGPFVVAVLTQDALAGEAVNFMQELALKVYRYGSR